MLTTAHPRPFVKLTVHTAMLTIAHSSVSTKLTENQYKVLNCIVTVSI
jgi:hypothetical protein